MDGWILRARRLSDRFDWQWGLGKPESESTPDKMGFDYFFGYNCQTDPMKLIVACPSLFTADAHPAAWPTS